MPERARVFVSRPIAEAPFRALTERFEVVVGPADRPTPAEELREACRDASGLVAMLTDRIDGAFLDACPALRVVGNFAVGVNNVDLAACEARGVWLTNTPDVLTDATADLALALILACARRLPQREAELRAGKWVGWAPMEGLAPPYRQLGIVGLGRIGAAVARRAQACGMEVRHFSRRRDAGDALGVSWLPLDELLGWSDVVSIHCPLTPETHHLIDAGRLAKTKRGAILVNTSRGPVVDEVAVAEALESGQLGAAGLDVFEQEPQVHPRLLAAPNALLLPHVGSATVDARTAMGMLAAQGVIDVLEGRVPRHAVVRPSRPRAPMRPA